MLPEPRQMVAENILLGRGESVSACRLERLDLFLSHVNQEGQVCRVSPEADCRVDAISGLSQTAIE